MAGPLAAYLIADHRRLEALLERAIADPTCFEHEAFEQFRAGLMRHIGIEEKILLADARERREGDPLPMARVLRVEHGALASLLVPTPDFELVREIRVLLEQHDPREEGPGGLYEVCEQLAGEKGALELLERAERAPEVRAAPHFDGPAACRTAREALERASSAAPPRSVVIRRRSGGG